MRLSLHHDRLRRPGRWHGRCVTLRGRLPTTPAGAAKMRADGLLSESPSFDAYTARQIFLLESQRDPRIEATDLSDPGWRAAVCAAGHRQLRLSGGACHGHAGDGTRHRWSWRRFDAGGRRMRSDAGPDGSGLPQPLRRALPHGPAERGSCRCAGCVASVAEQPLHPAPHPTARLARRSAGCLAQCAGGGVSAARPPALLPQSLIVQTIAR